MAYTIIRSDGSQLTTIQDGTVNTTSTSLGLPGRNYPGYGNIIDTNFVKLIENFASASVPAHPLKGQLWFNTTGGTLHVCPADGTTNSSDWVTVSTSLGGSSTLGNLTVTGNIDGNNLSITNSIVGDTITVRLATVTANTLTGNLSVTNSAEVGSLLTDTITTGGNTTSGSMTGRWSLDGDPSGAALAVTSGNITFASSSIGVKCDNYMYANGQPFTPSGTYTNANVSNYLTGSGGVTQFTGNIAPTKVTTSYLAGGVNAKVQGTWTLDTGATFQATYADLAERYEADDEYPVGTLVKLGGDKEVTIEDGLRSEDVFGVVSDSYAFLLNAEAGTSITHPAIALVGRVKVRVIGEVRKGQRLVSAGNGCAKGGQPSELTTFNVIGRALENKDDTGEGLVEAVVVIK